MAKYTLEDGSTIELDDCNRQQRIALAYTGHVVKQEPWKISAGFENLIQPRLHGQQLTGAQTVELFWLEAAAAAESMNEAKGEGKPDASG